MTASCGIIDNRLLSFKNEVDHLLSLTPFQSS